MKLTHIKRISTTSRMKYHRNYCEAKNGNLVAAQKLISDIIPDPMIFKNLTGYVCPVLKPKGNRIPLALAEYMAIHSKLILEDAIYLQHTPHGSTMCERLYYNPSYSGQITPEIYFIVDVVYTSGQTLKSLKKYIESAGGNVIAAWCIGSGPSLEFEPDRFLIKLLISKFPDISSYFEIETLTAPQVHYLLRLSSLNRLWKLHSDNQLNLLFA
jgi:hypothetical protein